jgi:hypothetical protein
MRARHLNEIVGAAADVGRDVRLAAIALHREDRDDAKGDRRSEGDAGPLHASLDQSRRATQEREERQHGAEQLQQSCRISGDL